MRGVLTIVTIVTCFILLEPAVMAEPPDGMTLANRYAHAADLGTLSTPASRLTTRAIASAQAGDCPTALKYGTAVHDLDRAYYEEDFTRDPAISACLGVRPPASPSAADEHHGFVFGGGLAFSDQGILQGELRFGWMLHPQISVFGAAALVTTLEDDGGGIRFLALGARAELEPLFVDLRIGQLSVPSGCDFDDPCVTHHRVGWSAGLGLELVHFAHFGLELRGDLLGLGKADGTILLAGLGFSIYL